MIELALGGILGGVLGEQERIMVRLKAAGAVSPETAVTPQTAKLTIWPDQRVLDSLVKQGKVGKTEDRRYWWKQKTIYQAEDKQLSHKGQVSVPVWPIILLVVLGIVVYVLWRFSVI